MSSWQSDTIQTNGIRLHVTRTGGAKPPLVLAHGYSDDGLCWTPVAEELAMAYDVVMPDARGHGLSDAPDGDYGPLEQAADLAGVIEGLGLQRPIIVGHSMGGLIALQLALTYPDLVSGLVLSNPVITGNVGPGLGAFLRSRLGQHPKCRCPSRQSVRAQK